MDGYVHSLFQDQCSAGFDLVDKRGERLLDRFVGSVDVEMVGVGSGDNGYVRIELQKRTVELIGLGNQPVALSEYQVAVEIFRNPAQKSTASISRFVVEPCGHSAGGRFAVRTGYSHQELVPRDYAQHSGAFFDLEIAVTEKEQLGAVRGNGRCVDDLCVGRIFKFGGNRIRCIFVRDVGSLSA